MTNTVIEAAVGADPADPAGLVTLAELVIEGFGWDNAFTTTSREAVAVLARELGDEVVTDDIGRRCVPRVVARRLFAERAEVERRRQEARERHEAKTAELAAKNRPRGGVPADRTPDGVFPAAAMLQAAKDAAPRRRTPLEEALDNDGSLTYHPIRDEEQQ